MTELHAIAPDLYAQCGLGMANSYEGALTLLSIYEVSLKERMSKLEQEASKAKALLITEVKARAERKDAIKKETLNFFDEIGFDMFSKAETDAVFNWLNNNPALWGSLGINSKFDIENGVLGYKGTFTNSGELPLQAKRVFVNVFNKMLTGSTDFPVCFDEMGDCAFYQTQEDAEAHKISMMFDMRFFRNQMLG